MDVVIGAGVIGTATTWKLSKVSNRSIVNVSLCTDQTDTASVANGCLVIGDYQPNRSIVNVVNHVWNGGVFGAWAALRSCGLSSWRSQKQPLCALCARGAAQIHDVLMKEQKKTPSIIYKKNKKHFYVDAHEWNQYMKQMSLKKTNVTFVKDRVVGFGILKQQHKKNKQRVTHVYCASGRIMETNKVYISCGWKTPEICSLLGVRVPIYPLTGYSVTAHWEGPPSARHSLKTFQTWISFGSKVRCTANTDFFKDGVVPANLVVKRWDKITKDLQRVYPDARGPYIKWVGHRPITPDALPIISNVEPFDNVYINAGHGPVGVTCCLSSADWVVNIPQDNPFSLERFSS